MACPRVVYVIISTKVQSSLVLFMVMIRHKRYCLMFVSIGMQARTQNWPISDPQPIIHALKTSLMANISKKGYYIQGIDLWLKKSPR
jgi:hypothetical protein